MDNFRKVLIIFGAKNFDLIVQAHSSLFGYFGEYFSLV